MAGHSTRFRTIPTKRDHRDRYYLGFDSRYRLGNLSLEPFFVYLSARATSAPPHADQYHRVGNPVACTSRVGSP